MLLPHAPPPCYWTKQEMSILLSLVQHRKTIIENKATNRTFRNLNIKNATWKEIGDLFNSDIRNIQAGTKFKTLDQLKAKWDNMKTTAKSRSDALKKHLNKTGASPDPNLVLTAEEEKVMDLMASVKDPIKCEFDNDTASVKSEDSVTSFQASPITLSTEQKERSAEPPKTDDRRSGPIGEACTAPKDGRKRSNPAIQSNPTLDEKRICFIDLQTKLVQERHVRCMQLMDCMEEAVNVWRYKIENSPLDQSGSVQEPLLLRDISAAENIITKSFDVLKDDKL